MKQIKISNGFSKQRTKENIFYACLIALPMLNFIVFYLGVNFNSILLAFKSYDAQGVASFVGFENFKAVFDNLKGEAVVAVSLKNSAFIYIFGLIFYEKFVKIIEHKH